IACLDDGVLDKGGAGFFGFRHAEGILRYHFNTEITENFLQFRDFLAIAGGENQLAHWLTRYRAISPKTFGHRRVSGPNWWSRSTTVRCKMRKPFFVQCVSKSFTVHRWMFGVSNH